MYAEAFSSFSKGNALMWDSLLQSSSHIRCVCFFPAPFPTCLDLVLLKPEVETVEIEQISYPNILACSSMLLCPHPHHSTLPLLATLCKTKRDVKLPFDPSDISFAF